MNPALLKLLPAVTLLGSVAWGPAAHAQASPPAGFALVGHIEKFVLTPAVSPTADPLTSSASVTVRGIEVVLPSNLVITMPGGYLTAAQLFKGRDLKTPSPRSGLALADATAASLACPAPMPGVTSCPLPAAEIELAGNIIAGRYIAGTARISQGGLHIGAGFIQSIDSSTGVFTVAPGPATRLRLNDPEGLYGPRQTPGVVDARFALDPGNSPIHARTGMPVCIEDAARPQVCPAGNRPADPNLRRYTCGTAPVTPLEPALAGCKPQLPVPLRVGDYVSYVGMLDKDNQGYFISLHGLEAELGVYTSRGVDPAYVFTEVAIQGTLGAIYPDIPQEATTAHKIVGFTTDPSRDVRVDIFDDDANTNPLPVTLEPTRLATKIVPTNLAQLGRFKMIWASKESARIVRRNVRVTLSDGTSGDDKFRPGNSSKSTGWPGRPAGASLRGGYAFGKFDAPVNEYISPELTQFGTKGWPLPVNFEDFCYLRITHMIETQEPKSGSATEYLTVTVNPVQPSPINPARPFSQQRADGSRVCGAL